MFPRKFNPRQLNQLMKQLGINVKEIANVEKVIIQTRDKDYIFDDAEVTVMDAQGQKTYQLIGTPRIVEKKEEIPEEDITLVMEKTGKNREEAKKALEESKGDIAEAILKLSE
ncbi:MAG TPA: nascent polypeptide-associated complex protein [Thermoplasmatales archaeon]|nr:nascent polypeptide-associated complex protein [Thermoplasmatales archaeon]